MIIIGLTLHRRNIRNAMSAGSGAGELYKTTITILVESSGLSFLSLLLYLGTWATRNFAQFVSSQLFAQTQVCTVELTVS